MALAASNNFEKEKRAPNFTLLNVVTQKLETLEELKGEKGTVILFICNHCPFVIHINEAIVLIGNDYQKKGINFIAISSNDIKNYPQDSPEKMKIIAKQLQYPFPYLYDATQKVAQAYNASCTPDIYLFDKKLKIFYHGQLDESRPGNGISVTGKDLKNAMDLLIQEKTYSQVQKPSIGCSIKWK
jgi:peroxiredoxin